MKLTFTPQELVVFFFTTEVGPARRRVISTPELESAGRPVILTTTKLGPARHRVVLFTPELSDLLVISPVHKISRDLIQLENYNINN
ncbi:hypothetical protein F2Q69_00036956 [Brassica cretica]|uniref:Uncharacterized protein n=1 Tax=Brassica cretica TaxID=69181 RepID=A0A8S9SSR1_BRACR|nr:hypothetical protein F2Q69_00036956 [Brassica cretica]